MSQKNINKRWTPKKCPECHFVEQYKGQNKPHYNDCYEIQRQWKSQKIAEKERERMNPSYRNWVDEPCEY
jgi:hypothetical protein